MKINKFTILLVLALLLFIAPFVIYYINFSDMPILKDNSAWGSFGSYLSGSFSVVIAGLTLTSLFILLQTLTETIESNQRQITISQHESELNNFNFITSIIIKNIENKSLSTNTYYPTHYFDEAKNIPHLCRNFAYCYNYSKDNYYLFMNDEKSYHLNVNKFINELHNNKPLKALVNDYAKKYALL
ncbi:hypothetical protein FAP79_19120, partial [Morganella morganii]|nr:hypothetical protein [Morganella morganii]